MHAESAFRASTRLPAYAGCSPSVTAAVRVGCQGGSDPDRLRVHEAVATEQKITVLGRVTSGAPSTTSWHFACWRPTCRSSRALEPGQERRRRGRRLDGARRSRGGDNTCLRPRTPLSAGCAERDEPHLARLHVHGVPPQWTSSRRRPAPLT